jgi:molybdopterin-guanine dinucleotide biosynthesis protein A
MNAFVLAGGLSSRMGRDKALLEWRGRPLIEHTLDKLRQTGFSPAIVGSRPELERFAPVIPDNVAQQGPLGAVEAALAATDAEFNLFLSVDMPLLSVGFLRWLVARAEITQAVATIPRIEGRPQPLCAIYHRRLLAGVRASLAQGDLKLVRAMEGAVRERGELVDAFDVETIDSALRGSEGWPMEVPVRLWFQNLNTPQDFDRMVLEQTACIR